MTLLPFAWLRPSTAALTIRVRSLDRTTVALFRALTVTQIALAVILVSGACLLLQTAYRLQQVRLGFDTDRTVMADVSLPSMRYRRDDLSFDFARQLVTTIGSWPGVTAAAFGTDVPVDGFRSCSLL